MRVRYMLFLLLIVVAAAGCQAGSNADTPPTIRYGEDTCDECRMIINEPEFAAAYTTTDGETRRFDDIGGMLIYDDKHGEDVAGFWVHDYETEEWVKASEATFVLGNELHTPMGHGIAAFATREPAEALANEVNGEVLTFTELQAGFEPGDMEMGMEHEH